MFRLHVAEKNYPNIYISGDQKLVSELKASLKNIIVNDYQTSKHASFNFEIEKLKNGCTDKFSGADVILNYIQPFINEISSYDIYLLQYWSYEVRMINNQQSYRSEISDAQLTSPDTLDEILDKVAEKGGIPLVEDDLTPF